jgi:hypothetical protein
MMPFAQMNDLMGFPAVHAFERRYGPINNEPQS